MIYFDNAATTLHKPAEVAEAVKDAILTLGNASRGAHEAALSGMRSLYAAREMLCELFHGDGPERTAFTLNSTMALNIIGLVLGFMMLLSPIFTLETIRYFAGMYLILLGVDSIVMAFSPMGRHR